MMFTTLSVLTVLAAFTGVHAQSSTTSGAVPTSTDGLSPCLLGCITQAASANGCSNFADLSCVCSNDQFMQQARSCLESSCSDADVTAAQKLQSQECAAASTAASSVANSATSGVSSANSAASSAISSIQSSLSSQISSITSAATSAASSAASSAVNTSNAASALAVGFGPSFGGMVGVGLALVGVVAGAALVL